MQQNSNVVSSNPEAQWLRHVRQHSGVVVFLVLTLVVVLLYAPAISAFFISDDFTYVTMLHRDITHLLAGQMWIEWFIGGPDGYLFFRPAGHALMLLDYVSWNLNPFGYHLTNILLHVVASFEVFVLSWKVVRNRVTASITALIFATLPIHAGAVSWVAARYDVLCGVYYFAGLIFYVLYIEKNKFRFLAFSLGAFMLALSAKEVAITLPLILLIYEIVYSLKKAAKIGDSLVRLIPFGTILTLYLGLRVFVIRSFGYPGEPLSLQNAWIWLGRVLQNAFDPFMGDLNQEGQWLLLSAIAFGLLLFRFRREIVFGLAWIAVPFVAIISSGPSDRSFYVSSFGVSLILAVILIHLLSNRNRALRLGTLFTFVWLIAIYGTTLFSRNEAFRKAGDIAEAIPRQVKLLHPTLPDGARLVFVGVLDQVPEGPLVYLTGFPGFLPLLYQKSDFRVFKFHSFPIWLGELDKTYFFEVDHRKVTERADLVRALEQRRQCQSALYPATQWDFTHDAQGWEPWNQLSDFLSRDGLLSARSEGTDPYMASPLIDIPSIAIGDVVVTMRVRSSKPEMKGRIYWLATGQNDFSPALQIPFTVLADGEYHTYHVDLSQSNQLLLGDHILRLRLNPVDDPADIGIKAIQVYSHCSELQSDYCRCSH